MAGIAIGESGGNTQAYNPVPPDNSVGLWQINYYGANAAQRIPRYGTPDQLLADPNRQAKAAIDLLGQNAAGIGNWQNDSTWNAWMRAGAPQAPSASVVQSWLNGNLGSPGAQAGSEINGYNSSGNAVGLVANSVGCNQSKADGSPGGVSIFGAHIGTQCQLKAMTGGLIIGVGLVTIAAGLFIIARNTSAGSAVLKAVPGPVGRAAKLLPKRSSPAATVKQAAPKAPSMAQQKRDQQAAKAAQAAQDEAVKQAQFAQMDANLRGSRRAA